MKVRQIFLDMDDVLNTCTMYGLQYVGCPVSATDYSKFDPAWGYDIVKAANHLHPDHQFTEDEFWPLIDRNFWATIPKSQECQWLLDVSAAIVGENNVCILSSSTRDGSCLAGKLDWIQSELPRWMHRQYLLGPRKQFCAAPDALLIDDRDYNVDTFRAAGGRAILVPRPWNSLHGVETMLWLVNELGKYSGPFSDLPGLTPEECILAKEILAEEEEDESVLG